MLNVFPFVENTATSTLIKGLTFFGDVMSMAFTLLTLTTHIYYATKDIRATHLV